MHVDCPSACIFPNYTAYLWVNRKYKLRFQFQLFCSFQLKPVDYHLFVLNVDILGVIKVAQIDEGNGKLNLLMWLCSGTYSEGVGVGVILIGRPDKMRNL